MFFGHSQDLWAQFPQLVPGVLVVGGVHPEAHHAHARRWTFRQSRRSTVGADTRDVLIVAEGMHPTASADVPALLDALAGQIEALWGAPRHRAVLTAAAPRLEFAV